MHQAAKSWSVVKPSLVSLLAVLSVITGLLLTTMNWWWLLLTLFGSVLPGLSREVGWLHDRDEYQMHAIRRAGYHAYLACVAVGIFLIAWLRATEAGRDKFLDVGGAENVAMLMVCLAWLTWLFSWLVSFWGAQRAASRTLLMFGLIWLTFTVLSNTGSEWNGWTVLLMHTLLAVPFLLLSRLALHLPRISGAILILLSIGFAGMFGFWRVDSAALLRQGPVLVLLVGPLLASGFALLACRANEEE